MTTDSANTVLDAVTADWLSWQSKKASSTGRPLPVWDTSLDALATEFDAPRSAFRVKSASGGFGKQLNEFRALNDTNLQYAILVCDPNDKVSISTILETSASLVREGRFVAVMTFRANGTPIDPQFSCACFVSSDDCALADMVKTIWPSTEVLQVAGITTFRKAILQVALAQPHYVCDVKAPAMIARRDALQQAKNCLLDLIEDDGNIVGARVKSCPGISDPARVPYLRIYDNQYSPTASVGYYVCLFVKGDGASISVSLQQPATKGSSEKFGQKSSSALVDQSIELHEFLLSHPIVGEKLSALGVTRGIDLTDALGDLGTTAANYSNSDIASVTFPTSSLPTDSTILNVVVNLMEGARTLNSLANETISPFNVDIVADAINWTVDRTADVIESLADSSPQIVLAGPPGTGKTYVARWIASAILGEPGILHNPRITFVQFHPTYGYEDFVEGLRPVSSDGVVTFETVPGPIVRLAREIEEDGLPRVLIIDEINRANIPRVFGELMYLLEYRDQSINLMLEEDFQLPSQLHIIATMNTSDKSTRVMDVALRRRFDFFQLDPDVEVLRSHYEGSASNELGEELFSGFLKMNQRLYEDLDRHRLIGHSYFMSQKFGVAELRARWDRQISPLLDEYFFELQVQGAQYQLEDFWPSAAS